MNPFSNDPSARTPDQPFGDTPESRRLRARARASKKRRSRVIVGAIVTAALAMTAVVGYTVHQPAFARDLRAATSPAAATSSATPTTSSSSPAATTAPLVAPTPAATTSPAAGPSTAATAPATAAQSAVSATTSALASAAAKAAANAPMPVGNVVSNGRTWVQSYAEDFNTPAPLGSVLSTYPELKAYDGFTDTSKKGLYSPAKVLSVSNGNLDYYLHSENGQPLVSTVIPDDYTPHTTGRYSIRYKVDSIAGYKFVAMFWPENNDFNDGELDWPEGDLTGNVFASSKVPGTASTGVQQYLSNNVKMAADTYHVVTLEWDTTEVRFYMDGVLIGTTTQLPTTSMRLTLQAETTTDTVPVPASAAGHIDIDWISIWN